MTDRRWRRPSDRDPVIGRDDFDSILAAADVAEPGDDEFVIGAAPAPRQAPPAPPPQQRRPFPGPMRSVAVPPLRVRDYDDVEDDGYVGDDEYDDDYDQGFYLDEEPARQPMFYAFLALAVVVGGLFVYFLIRVMSGNDDGAAPVAGGGDAQIELSVDAPASGERVEVGAEVDVLVRASSNEDVIRFELYRGSTVVDRVAASPPDPGGVYSVVLKTRFETKGEFPFVVRVTTESGSFKDSEEVRVVVVEPVTDDRPAIRGRALALVTLRVGPGDSFAAAGQLQPGEEVDILGKTRDVGWLLVARSGGLWVPRTAIQEFDSLALVPVREPTPTPVPATPTPTPSATGSPSPSASPSPTVPVNAPDFLPMNAVLLDGGSRLRITVANLAPNRYQGPVVVSVADVGVGGTLLQAFNVTLPPNGSDVVEFEIDPPVTSEKTARVVVDPDNAVVESNEDNNAASFGLRPPADAPDLVIIVLDVNATHVVVAIRNDGGPLSPTGVTVRVTLGNDAASSSTTLALAKGQTSSQISVLRPPGEGMALIEVVLANGQIAASLEVEIPAP